MLSGSPYHLSFSWEAFILYHPPCSVAQFSPHSTHAYTVFGKAHGILRIVLQNQSCEHFLLSSLVLCRTKAILYNKDDDHVAHQDVKLLVFSCKDTSFDEWTDIFRPLNIILYLEYDYLKANEALCSQFLFSNSP